MMKADDKELVLPPDDEPEKVPKIEVYTSKVIQASKKPWFAGCLGLVLASFAVLLSLILLATVLAYIGYLPQQIEDVFITTDPSGKMLDPHQDICFQRMDAGSCSDTIPRWYFDTNKAKCLQFVYSGCEGNLNNFETEYDCNAKCFSWGDDYLIPPFIPEVQPRDGDDDGEPKNSCFDEPDAGNCNGYKVRYYFDKTENACKTFIYGGCQGNRNNFLSERDCLDACSSSVDLRKRDICKLRPETGSCRGSFEKWFFNADSGECQVFEYGGCDGNENNFDSKENCENQCKKPTTMESRKGQQLSESEEVCNLPSETGPCRAANPRFYFNAQAGKCEMFLYGGCNGNANNFQSMEDCEARCKQP